MDLPRASLSQTEGDYGGAVRTACKFSFVCGRTWQYDPIPVCIPDGLFTLPVLRMCRGESCCAGSDAYGSQSGQCFLPGGRTIVISNLPAVSNRPVPNKRNEQDIRQQDLVLRPTERKKKKKKKKEILDRCLDSV